MQVQELHALIQGKISPQVIPLDQLIALAEQYPDFNSSEYKLIELALNIVLASYLDKALVCL
jgi:hypothetical protein